MQRPVLAALLLAACATPLPPAPGDEGGGGGWRMPTFGSGGTAPRAASGERAAPDAAAILLDEDREKLARLRETQAAALFDGFLRPSRDARSVEVSRDVLTAAATDLGEAPLTGAYRCRTLKHGGPAPFVAYGYFDCRVSAEAGRLILEKPTGSQRMLGSLLVAPSVGADGQRALLYAGTEYGTDEAPTTYPEGQREVGLFERIGEDRYRLLIPEPGVEGMLDVIDLTREG